MSKKVLLFLLCALPLPLLAQLTLTATFDFSNPTGLNPPVTPMDYEGGKMNVMSKVFHDKDISLSFGAKGQGGGGAQIITVGSTQPFTYSLRMTQGTLIYFTATDGCLLNSITLSDDSAKGDLSLDANQAGSLSGYTWSCEAGTPSVTFFTDGSSKWKKVTVRYTAKKNVLMPTIDIGNTLSTFSSMTLTFSGKMHAVSTAGITIEGTGITGKKALVCTVADNVVKLSLPTNEAITTDGSYVVTVPEGCFEDESGYGNVALQHEFTVRTPRNTLAVTSITPQSGSKLDTLPEKILVKFEKPIKIKAGIAVDMLLGGEYEATLNTAVSASNSSTLEIETVDIDKYGVYQISLPEGLVHTTAYGTASEAANDRWNAAFKITYTKVEPVDTLKGLKDEMEALKREAAAQYKLINTVGYPKADDAISPLAAVKDLEIPNTEKELKEAIAGLKAALKAFYNCQDIVFPIAQKWYTIASVNSGNKTATLAYSDGAVVLGGKAQPFRVESITSDGVVVLAMKDGKNGQGQTAYKYLHVLTAVDDYFGTSSKNVTDEKTFVNNLTLAKMAVKDDDQRAVAGLFTMKGSLGIDKTTGDKIADTYAQVTFGGSAAQITTTAGDDSLYFDSSKTSAFRFVETTEPADTDSTPIEPLARLSVTSTYTTTVSITLLFTNITTVELADASKAYFSTDYEGKNRVELQEGLVILSKSATESNVFEVHLSGLDAGRYYLQLPKGTFDYSKNSRPVKDMDLLYEFSLNEPESYFQTTYSTYLEMQVLDIYGFTDVIQDIDLNKLVIAAEVPAFYSDLVPDPSKTIKVINIYSWDVVGYGHFEPFTTFASSYPNYSMGYKAIKLVMDQPVKAGDLDGRADTYGYIIPEATFGDANFGRYLAGEKGIRKEDCVVNAYHTGPFFIVDNARALKAGDVNGDKVIDVADIASIIDVMSGSASYPNADVNHDYAVDVSDIATVIDMMSGKED